MMSSVSPGESVDSVSRLPIGGESILLRVAAVIICPALYLLFIFHYATNVPYEDDWTVVPLIHSAIHGSLSFTGLWTLHDENRIFLPNLLYVAVGAWDHDNLRVLNAISAFSLIASFLLYLRLFRAYLRRSLTPLSILAIALVWFSLADWENALWGFQVAWYLILLCLMLMLYCFFIFRGWFSLVFAGLAAVAASVCFFQGLSLWPIGVVCLIWSRRRGVELVAWIGAGVVTVVVSLWGYNFRALGCTNASGGLQFACGKGASFFALHHPGKLLAFLAVEIGDIIPNSNPHTLWLNGLLGAAIFAAAVWVTIRSLRERRNCLPVALMTFALLFDLFVAFARVQFLTELATAPVYTMPNLLMVVALVTYAWTHLQRHQTLAIGLACLLVAQVVVSTNSGILNARKWDQDRLTGARLVVNLDKIPATHRGCYAFFGEFVYLIFAPAVSGSYVGFTEAEQDHLSVFSSGPYQRYRSKGLPEIRQCAGG